MISIREPARFYPCSGASWVYVRTKGVPFTSADPGLLLRFPVRGSAACHHGALALNRGGSGRMSIEDCQGYTLGKMKLKASGEYVIERITITRRLARSRTTSATQVEGQVILQNRMRYEFVPSAQNWADASGDLSPAPK